MNTILLLEDDQVLSKEIITFLTNNDYHCDCVYDGVILDMHMNNLKSIKKLSNVITSQ